MRTIEHKLIPIIRWHGAQSPNEIPSSELTIQKQENLNNAMLPLVLQRPDPLGHVAQDKTADKHILPFKLIHLQQHRMESDKCNRFINILT